MNISVIGLGRVGLCMAVYFAHRGYNVVALDIDQRKLQLIRKGKSPFFEPGLEDMLNTVLRNGKIKVTSKEKDVILKTDMTFITVGTPTLPDGSVDLTFIKRAAKEIGYALRSKNGYHLVLIRSTIPPGTTQNLIKPLLENCSSKRAGKDFGILVNPEFLKEGSAIHDLSNPDRVIIGEFEERSGSIFERFIREVYGDRVPVLRMSPTEAEMVKYANNCFLAMKISFINEIANICERVPGTDVVKIAHAIGLDPRIGAEFLKAGAGWGGSCLPKDTRALVSFSKKLGYNPEVIEAAIAVNEKRAEHVVEIAEKELSGLKGKKVSVLGLSFKPETDDVREAVSIRIIMNLLQKGSMVSVYDPAAISNIKKIFGDKLHYSKDIKECLTNSECCLIITEWDEFKHLRPQDFIRLMSNPLVIDARRIYDPERFCKELKFRAVGLSNET